MSDVETIGAAVAVAVYVVGIPVVAGVCEEQDEPAIGTGILWPVVAVFAVVSLILYLPVAALYRAGVRWGRL